MRKIICFSAMLNLILISCVQKSQQDKKIIIEMRKSLETSNSSINNSSQFILHDLEEKQYESWTSEKAKYWFPKAERISSISKPYYTYLEELKKFEKLTKNQSDILYSTLSKIQNDIISSDSNLLQTFSEIKNPLIDSLSNNNFFETYIKSASSESLKGYLTQLQNRLRTFELKCITFCNEQIGSTDGEGFFTSYSVIVGQNFETLKKGAEIEITAGVGAFSKSSRPEIKINGNLAEINESGYCIFKKKINKPPGKYSIPVEINYTDQDGKKQTIQKSITYTVAKECDQ